MAINITSMTAAENTAHAANKPLFLATNNSDKITKATSGWFDSNTGSTDDTNETVVSNARVRAYDRIGGLTVASDTARTSPVFRLSISSTITFDTVVILGHNFGNVTNSGSSITASILASDNTGSKSVSDALTVASGSNDRLVFTHLYDASGSKPASPQRI